MEILFNFCIYFFKFERENLILCQMMEDSKASNRLQDLENFRNQGILVSLKKVNIIF